MILVRLGRRAGWGIADQTISSLTNFALGILVARQATPEGFGSFALAFVTYVLILNLGRAAVSFPLMIRYSGDEVRWSDGAARGAGAAVVIGIVCGLACAVAALVVGGDLGSALLAIGLCMPGLLLQDAWRFAFFSAGRDRDAFLNDLVWALGLVAAFGLTLATHANSVFILVLAWGVTASVAAVFGRFQAGLMPAIGGTPSWFREHTDLIPRFATETVARVGFEPVTLYLIGLIGGLGAVGALRAGALVLGPFNILFQGVHLVALPEARRARLSSLSVLMRWCIGLSGVMAGAAAIFGTLVLLLPDPFGEALLGASWAPAGSVLLPLTIGLIGFVAAAGAVVGLRALEAAGRVMRAAIATSAVGLAGAVVGTFAAGAPGAAWGIALGSWVGTVLAWLEVRAAVRGVTAAPE